MEKNMDNLSIGFLSTNELVSIVQKYHPEIDAKTIESMTNNHFLKAEYVDDIPFYSSTIFSNFDALYAHYQNYVPKSGKDFTITEVSRITGIPESTIYEMESHEFITYDKLFDGVEYYSSETIKTLMESDIIEKFNQFMEEELDQELEIGEREQSTSDQSDDESPEAIPDDDEELSPEDDEDLLDEEENKKINPFAGKMHGMTTAEVYKQQMERLRELDESEKEYQKHLADEVEYQRRLKEANASFEKTHATQSHTHQYSAEFAAMSTYDAAYYQDRLSAYDENRIKLERAAELERQRLDAIALENKRLREGVYREASYGSTEATRAHAQGMMPTPSTSPSVQSTSDVYRGNPYIESFKENVESSPQVVAAQIKYREAESSYRDIIYAAPQLSEPISGYRVSSPDSFIGEERPVSPEYTPPIDAAQTRYSSEYPLHTEAVPSYYQPEPTQGSSGVLNPEVPHAETQYSEAQHMEAPHTESPHTEVPHSESSHTETPYVATPTISPEYHSYSEYSYHQPEYPEALTSKYVSHIEESSPANPLVYPDLPKDPATNAPDSYSQPSPYTENRLDTLRYKIEETKAAYESSVTQADVYRQMAATTQAEISSLEKKMDENTAYLSQAEQHYKDTYSAKTAAEQTITESRRDVFAFRTETDIARDAAFEAKAKYDTISEAPQSYSASETALAKKEYEDALSTFESSVSKYNDAVSRYREVRAETAPIVASYIAAEADYKQAQLRSEQIGESIQYAKEQLKKTEAAQTAAEDLSISISNASQSLSDYYEKERLAESKRVTFIDAQSKLHEIEGNPALSTPESIDTARTLAEKARIEYESAKGVASQYATVASDSAQLAALRQSQTASIIADASRQTSDYSLSSYAHTIETRISEYDSVIKEREEYARSLQKSIDTTAALQPTTPEEKVIVDSRLAFQKEALASVTSEIDSIKHTSEAYRVELNAVNTIKENKAAQIETEKAIYSSQQVVILQSSALEQASIAYKQAEVGLSFAVSAEKAAYDAYLKAESNYLSTIATDGVSQDSIQRVLSESKDKDRIAQEYSQKRAAAEERFNLAAQNVSLATETLAKTQAETADLIRERDKYIQYDRFSSDFTSRASELEMVSRVEVPQAHSALEAAKASLASAQDRLHEAESKIEGLRADYTKALSAYNESIQPNSGYNGDKAQAFKEYRAIESQWKLYSSQRDSAQSDVALQSQNLADAQSAFDRVVAKQTALSQERTAMVEILSSPESISTSTIASTLTTRISEVKTLDRELATCNNNINAIKADIEVLKQSNKPTLAQEVALSAEQEKLSFYTRQKETATAAITVLTNNASVASVSAAYATVKATQIAEISNNIESANNQITLLQNQSTQARNELSSIDRLMKTEEERLAILQRNSTLAPEVYTGQISDAQKRIEELAVSKEKISGTIAQTAQDIVTATSKRDFYQKELEAAQAETVSLFTDVQNKDNSFSTLIKSKESEIESLSSETSTLAGKLQTSTKTVDMLSEQSKHLSQQISDIDKEIAKARDTIAGIDPRSKENDAKIAQLESHIETLNTRKGSLINEEATVQQQITDTRYEVAQIQADINTRATQIEAKKGELSALVVEQGKYQKGFDSSSGIPQNAEASFATLVKSKESEIAGLSSEASVLATRLETSNKTIGTLSEQSKHISQQITDIDKEITKARDTIAGMDPHSKESEAKIAQLESHIETLNTRKGFLVNEEATVQQQIKDTRSEAAQIQADINNRTSQIQSKKDELSSLVAAHGGSASGTQTSAQHHPNPELLATEASTLQNTISSLKSSISQQEKSNIVLSQEITALKKQRADAIADATSQRNTVTELQNSLKKAEDSGAPVAEINSLKQQVGDAKAKLAHTEQTVQNINNDIAQKQTVLTNQKENLQNQIKEKSIASQRLAAVTILARTQTEISATKESISALSKNVSAFESERVRISEAIGKSNEKISTLQSQISDLKSKPVLNDKDANKLKKLEADLVSEQKNNSNLLKGSKKNAEKLSEAQDMLKSEKLRLGKLETKEKSLLEDRMANPNSILPSQVAKAKFNAFTANASLERATASVSLAQSVLKAKEKKLNLLSKLEKTGAVTKLEIEQARIEVAQASAKLNDAIANQKVLQGKFESAEATLAAVNNQRGNTNQQSPKTRFKKIVQEKPIDKQNGKHLISDRIKPKGGKQIGTGETKPATSDKNARIRNKASAAAGIAGAVAVGGTVKAAKEIGKAAKEIGRAAQAEFIQPAKKSKTGAFGTNEQSGKTKLLGMGTQLKDNINDGPTPQRASRKAVLSGYAKATAKRVKSRTTKSVSTGTAHTHVGARKALRTAKGIATGKNYNPPSKRIVRGRDSLGAKRTVQTFIISPLFGNFQHSGAWHKAFRNMAKSLKANTMNYSHMLGHTIIRYTQIGQTDTAQGARLIATYAAPIALMFIVPGTKSAHFASMRKAKGRIIGDGVDLKDTFNLFAKKGIFKQRGINLSSQHSINRFISSMNKFGLKNGLGRLGSMDLAKLKSIDMSKLSAAQQAAVKSAIEFRELLNFDSDSVIRNLKQLGVKTKITHLDLQSFSQIRLLQRSINSRIEDLQQRLGAKGITNAEKLKIKNQIKQLKKYQKDIANVGKKAGATKGAKRRRGMAFMRLSQNIVGGLDVFDGAMMLARATSSATRAAKASFKAAKLAGKAGIAVVKLTTYVPRKVVAAIGRKTGLTQKIKSTKGYTRLSNANTKVKNAKKALGDSVEKFKSRPRIRTRVKEGIKKRFGNTKLGKVTSKLMKPVKGVQKGFAAVSKAFNAVKGFLLKAAGIMLGIFMILAIIVCIVEGSLSVVTPFAHEDEEDSSKSLALTVAEELQAKDNKWVENLQNGANYSFAYNSSQRYQNPSGNYIDLTAFTKVNVSYKDSAGNILSECPSNAKAILTMSNAYFQDEFNNNDTKKDFKKYTCGKSRWFSEDIVGVWEETHKTEGYYSAVYTCASSACQTGTYYCTNPKPARLHTPNASDYQYRPNGCVPRDEVSTTLYYTFILHKASDGAISIEFVTVNDWNTLINRDDYFQLATGNGTINSAVPIYRFTSTEATSSCPNRKTRTANLPSPFYATYNYGAIPNYTRKIHLTSVGYYEDGKFNQLVFSGTMLPYSFDWGTYQQTYCDCPKCNGHSIKYCTGHVDLNVYGTIYGVQCYDPVEQIYVVDDYVKLVNQDTDPNVGGMQYSASNPNKYGFTGWAQGGIIDNDMREWFKQCYASDWNESYELNLEAFRTTTAGSTGGGTTGNPHTVQLTETQRKYVELAKEAIDSNASMSAKEKEVRKAALDAGLSLCGHVPYVYGAKASSIDGHISGLDCTGYASWCYAKATGNNGYNTNGIAAYTYRNASPIYVGNPSNAKPGDLLDMGGSGAAGHVGIFVGFTADNRVISLECRGGAGACVMIRDTSWWDNPWCVVKNAW